MGEPSLYRVLIDTLETAVVTNPAGAFDAAKSLVESTCRTILDEREVGFDKNWDVPKLLKETLREVNLVPDGFDEGLTNTVRKLGGGLSTMIQGLAELRNQAGMFGHGPSAHVATLDPIHALFAARAADNVVHLLYTAHRDYPSPTAAPPLELDDNQDFNDSVDLDNDEVLIYTSSYSASEVLFRVDPDQYRVLLSEHLARSEDIEEAAEAQPAEAQPAEAQPAEAQPAEAQPAEAQPAEAQPAEAQPAEAQPAEAQPAEAQPAEAQPTPNIWRSIVRMAMPGATFSSNRTSASKKPSPPTEVVRKASTESTTAEEDVGLPNTDPEAE